MTNCNYSEHTKMQRKEIQKQIEELQAKLEELENQRPQMTLDKSGDIDIVSYDLKYYYRMGFSSTGHSWWVRGIGHTALIKVDDPETLVKLEKLYEDMILDTGGVVEPEQGTWNYDPDAKFRKQEQVKKLQQKDWTYEVTDEKGETNPYKQHLNPKKSNNLYDVIADWWDEIFMNGNPSGQNIESLVEQIVKFVPDAIIEPDEDWDYGYNDYRYKIMKKFKGR